MKITAAIIAFNEEAKIADCIKSVDWAAEVVVVDSESTDRTREIAAGLGARVITNPWTGFATQKQLAVNSAENEWILSLDADERVSVGLRDEILQLAGRHHTADGYRIPRLSFYMGRPIRHSGWYPDKQLRLFDRRRGKWKPLLIHESVEMDPTAKVADLTHDIEHFSVDNAEHHHRMIGERYAPLSAHQMFEAGKRATPLKIITAGPGAFLRSYVLKGGFLDGLPGFCISRFAAHHAFLKQLILWELGQKK